MSSSLSLKKSPEDERIRTLYVGGIYGRITEEDLRDHFSAYSELESVKMVPRRACAFVTYTSRKGAEKAANELSDNLEIKGLPLQTQMIQPFYTSTDPHRTAEGSTAVSGERVETQTMPSGGVKRSSDPLEGMSPQEMRERMMRRKKGSSTSTSTPPPATATSTLVPPVTPLVSPGMAANTQVGSAPVMESSEETPLTRFDTSFPRDFLLQKSGVTTLWPDADSLLFPGPMHLLEKKSDIELVNDATEMTLRAMQSVLMLRRRLLAQLEQLDVWCVRLAEAEAAEARMSSQLREATTQIQSLKEVAARAATAIEALDARENLLMTADAQLREMTEKMRLKSEELKDAASSADLRARAKLMREFLDGKSSSWDPQAEIDFYVAHVGEEADLV